MSLREAINLCNAVFKKQYSKANVIALWPEETLATFTLEELQTLEKNVDDEMRECLNDPLCKRLKIRIGYAKARKESGN